jgi:hypothetical protein
MTSATEQRAIVEFEPDPDVMPAADELHLIARSLARFWPKAAARMHAIACEHARMAEVLDQEVGQAAAEWRAVGAFW